MSNDSSGANYIEIVCHRCRRSLHILFDGTPPQIETEVVHVVQPAEGLDSTGSSPSSASPNSGISFRDLLRQEPDEDSTNATEQEIVPTPSTSFSIFKRNTVSLAKSPIKSSSPSTTPRSATTQPPKVQTQIVQNSGEYKHWQDQNKMFITKLIHYAAKDNRVDQLVCTECAETIITKLHGDFNELSDELKQYESFLNENESNNQPIDEEALLRELHELEKEEQSLSEQLANAITEETELKQKDEEWELKNAEWKQKEGQYWMEFNQFQMSHQTFEQERDALQQKIAHVSRELDRLNSTNVFNDSFHIWYEGHFGTINNFRLGKLPTQAVEWNEINAAWGQAALLLYILARHKKVVFTKYRIAPMGSFSKMELVGDSTTSYELYGGGGGLFWASRFDKAMVAFLHCMKEYAEYLVQQDASFELPYKYV
jgi:beclin 1